MPTIYSIQCLHCWEKGCARPDVFGPLQAIKLSRTHIVRCTFVARYYKLQSEGRGANQDGFIYIVFIYICENGFVYHEAKNSVTKLRAHCLRVAILLLMPLVRIDRVRNHFALIPFVVWRAPMPPTHDSISGQQQQQCAQSECPDVWLFGAATRKRSRTQIDTPKSSLRNACGQRVPKCGVSANARVKYRILSSRRTRTRKEEFGCPCRSKIKTTGAYNVSHPHSHCLSLSYLYLSRGIAVCQPARPAHNDDNADKLL